MERHSLVSKTGGPAGSKTELSEVCSTRCWCPPPHDFQRSYPNADGNRRPTHATFSHTTVQSVMHSKAEESTQLVAAGKFANTVARRWSGQPVQYPCISSPPESQPSPQCHTTAQPNSTQLFTTTLSKHTVITPTERTVVCHHSGDGGNSERKSTNTTTTATTRSPHNNETPPQQQRITTTNNKQQTKNSDDNDNDNNNNDDHNHNDTMTTKSSNSWKSSPSKSSTSSSIKEATNEAKKQRSKEVKSQCGVGAATVNSE